MGYPGRIKEMRFLEIESFTLGRLQYVFGAPFHAFSV